MTIHLAEVDTLELAKKALEIAQANPGHVYQAVGDPKELGSCLYVDPVSLTGSCLFGRAFISLGVDVGELLSVNDQGIEDFVDDQSYTLGMVQGAQDVGTRWGDPQVAGALAGFIEQRESGS